MLRFVEFLAKNVFIFPSILVSFEGILVLITVALFFLGKRFKI